MNRREILNLIGVGGIGTMVGTMIGYYVGAKELLGIQSAGSSTRSSSPKPTATEPPATEPPETEPPETDPPHTPTETSNAGQVVDGFESAAYDDGTPVEWQIKSPGEYIRVQSDTVKNGQYALEAKSGQDSNNPVHLYYHSEGRELKENDVYQLWIRPSYRAYWSLRPELDTSRYAIQMMATADHSELVVRTFDRNENRLDRKNLGESERDNWYLFQLEMHPAASELIGRAYDADKNLLGERSITLPDTTTYPYTMLTLPTPFGGQVTGWYDDVTV